MTKRFTFTTSIWRDDDEIDVRVTYTCTPFSASLYLDPSEACQVEIEEAEFVGVDAASMPAPLSDAEFEVLIDAASDRAWDDWQEERAAHAEYRADQARDRAMIERWEREQGEQA